MPVGRGRRVVVLVEGESDRVALLTLAARRGRDLGLEGVDVVSMRGVTNIRAFALQYGPRGLDARLAGLYDAPEEHHVRRGLTAAGVDVSDEANGLADAGFFRCTDDLEDELIRALGAEAVEAVVDTAGESRSLRLLAGMPAQRDWTRTEVLHRFLGVRSGRKARYAALLVDALPTDQVPAPLAAVLTYAEGS